MSRLAVRDDVGAGRFDKIMTARNRPSPEQAVRKLTADRLPGEPEALRPCAARGVSEVDYHEKIKPV